MAETAVATGPQHHVVRFYEDHAVLVDTVTRYASQGLNQGDTVILIATASHLETITDTLANGAAAGGQPPSGQLVCLDAADTLAGFMDGDYPDPIAFDHVVGTLLRGTRGPVRAFGEMVALLWSDGQVRAAMKLEQLWNELGQQTPFALLCAYDVLGVDGPGTDLDAVCHLHSQVIGSGVPDVARPRPADAVLEHHFPCSPDAPTQARSIVTTTLAGWSRNDLADAAAVIITEFATNAVRHADSAFNVSISQYGDTIRISVQDCGPAVPWRCDPPVTELSGRGLGLVDHLAKRWGTDLAEAGKVVWAEL